MDQEATTFGLSPDKLACLWDIGSDGREPTTKESAYSLGNEPEIEGYDIIDRLGQGAMSTVWWAVQLSTQREVALKVLSSATFPSRKALSRFEREVELAARLNHPNIAAVYDSGLHHGQYYYAMELVKGQQLHRFVREHNLNQRQVLELMQMVCQAVRYAHQLGVIHRDLKPSNILVTEDGQPHVLDFGLAKTLAEGDSSLNVSVDGEMLGTLAYMSPEQAAGHIDSIDVRTDVYSLGIMLFNLLTNEWPYDLSGSPYEILKNIQEKEPIRPSRLDPRLDADVEAIVLKALSKEPSQRYQSAAELAHDIRCWLEGLPIVARSVSSLYLLKKMIMRHRTVGIVTALLFIIIVSTSFISLYSYSQARNALKQSQSRQEAYKTPAKRNLTFAHQVVFASFLELWHDDKIARAEGFIIHFDSDSRERMGSLFLLDPRPLAEKEADFRKKLSTNQSAFWAFLVGEYHLKNKNRTEAVEAYEQCLQISQGSSDLDDWFKNRAKRKLNELANNGIAVKSCPNISDDE